MDVKTIFEVVQECCPCSEAASVTAAALTKFTGRLSAEVMEFEECEGQAVVDQTIAWLQNVNSFELKALRLHGEAKWNQEAMATVLDHTMVDVDKEYRALLNPCISLNENWVLQKECGKAMEKQYKHICNFLICRQLQVCRLTCSNFSMTDAEFTQEFEEYLLPTVQAAFPRSSLPQLYTYPRKHQFNYLENLNYMLIGYCLLNRDWTDKWFCWQQWWGARDVNIRRDETALQLAGLRATLRDTRFMVDAGQHNEADVFWKELEVCIAREVAMAEAGLETLDALITSFFAEVDQTSSIHLLLPELGNAGKLYLNIVHQLYMLLLHSSYWRLLTTCCEANHSMEVPPEYECFEWRPKPYALKGICLWSLIKKGHFKNGNPAFRVYLKSTPVPETPFLYGVVPYPVDEDIHPDCTIVFTSLTAKTEFLEQPQVYLEKLEDLCLNNVSLAVLLNIWKLSPQRPPSYFSCSRNLKINTAIQTSDTFNSGDGSDLSLLQMKQHAVKHCHLLDFETHSSQTHDSHFRSTVSTQVYSPRNKCVDTLAEVATNTGPLPRGLYLKNEY
eukprot:Platyproteum_vivax@DN3404_c0_g1_i1.p1